MYQSQQQAPTPQQTSPQQQQQGVPGQQVQQQQQQQAGGNQQHFAPPCSAPLVIDDLPYECAEADLLLLLQPFGRVKTMNVMRHPQKRCLYCVAEFYNPQQAEVARSMLDGQMFKGVKLR